MHRLFCQYFSLLILVGCGSSDSNKLRPPIPVPVCNATVVWEIPINRVNGTTLDIKDIDKYTIFVNSEEGKNFSFLVREIDIENPRLTQWLVPNLSLGEYWFYMRVTDTEDRQSVLSNEVTKQC